MEKIIWNTEEILKRYQQPFFELINDAYLYHKSHFNVSDIEFCVLSNIKTGVCPEDCAYCPQSGHYKTGLKKENLMEFNKFIIHAKKAKKTGAKRLCIGAAWRNPPQKDFPKVLEMIKAIKDLGMESCATLGLLNSTQAAELKQAGLDYYNHNLDTSPTYYPNIITTRRYEDRLNTIQHVIHAGINVCCGGILGMGESRTDRIELLLALYRLPAPVQSIPINKLIPIPGTPLENNLPIDPFEFIKTIAITRLMFPKTKIRLSAGRENMSDEMQAWCFMAGANSIFIGDTLLTAKNPSIQHDINLLKTLNLNSIPLENSENNA